MRLHTSPVIRAAVLLPLVFPRDAYATFRGSGEGDGLLFIAIIAMIAIYLFVAKVHARFPNFFPSLVALLMCMVVAGAAAEILYYMQIIDGYGRRDLIIVGGFALWAFVLHKLL